MDNPSQPANPHGWSWFWPKQLMPFTLQVPCDHEPVNYLDAHLSDPWRAM